jgi:hypothetical protein
LTFSFAWLYWFQADMLALAQFGLSGGKTHYDRTVGAVIITTVLFIVQLLAYAFIRHSGRMHALTYLPSFIMLAFVSSVSYPFSWGAWRWAAPLLLAVWIVVTIGIKRADHRVDTPHENGGLFTRQLWVNLLQMAFMMLGVAAVSNTNAVDHFKAHAEVALCQSDPAEALRVGRRSQETDATLTMLRAFALSQEGKLGEQLFQYAITGNSKDLLPLPGSNAKLKMLPDSVVWQHIGFRPDTLGTRIDSIDGPYVDYRLTGFLIDRKLDAFVSHLTRYYSTDADSLPYHYREALMLYQQRIDTAFAYADSAMLNRWHDFARLDTLYPKRSERKVRQMDHHRDTYWFYYDQ